MKKVVRWVAAAGGILGLAALWLWTVQGPLASTVCQQNTEHTLFGGLIVIPASLRITACGGIIRRDGKAAWAYVTRGRAHASRSDYDRAIADYAEAIRLEPEDAVTYR